MPDIKEVDVLADYGLTLDHFYGIVKKQVSNLQANQYIQLQAAAVPLDISSSYKWFSYGNLNAFFDVRLEPTPVADNVTQLAGARLSSEYESFIAEMLGLVEFKELSAETLRKIDELQTAILNMGSRIRALQKSRLDDWETYASTSMQDRGDLAIFVHWCQGHYATREIRDLESEQARNQARISALRLRKYSDPNQQAVVDAYAKATGPGSRMRYPRYPDREYGDEAKKFNAVYFASLPDNESNLFYNRQLATTRSSLDTIATGTLGGFSDTISKHSSANSSITTDWSASGSGGWGPFKFKANVSSHTKIKDDFQATQEIKVGARSVQAIAIDASAWLEPGMFRHPLVAANRRVFERYLGDRGSLLYYPTHLIMARGLNLKFSSSQSWQHDYESDFSTSGSASASFFGVSWGGGGSYSQSIREQKVERRGNDLILDDGDNIRVLGYVATKNNDLVSDYLRSFHRKELEAAFT